MDAIIKAIKKYEDKETEIDRYRFAGRVHIGYQIQVFREQMKLGSVEFARRLGISRMYLWELENGRKMLSEKLLERLKGLK